VVCTQARNAAALAAAEVVADQMGVKLGDEVGYSVTVKEYSAPGENHPTHQWHM